MHIGIFTDDFYPESGGVSRSIQLQLAQLAKSGHQVTLFAPQIHLKPPEVPWVGLPYWRLPGTPSYMCSLQATPGLARRIMADHKLDIVHSQNERGSLFLAGMISRELGIPHVHTFHSNYVGTHQTTPIASGLNSLTYLDWSSRLFARSSGRKVPPPGTSDRGLAGRDWRSLALIAGAVDAFTSPAAYLVDSIIKASPELAGRGHVVASGVAEAFGKVVRRRPMTPPIRFLSCGRLGPEKRVDVILEAFELLGREDAELHIIGTGPAERSLRHRAGRITGGSAKLLGHFEDTATLAQAIADADVFVLASYGFDTQGMVLAEAASAGTPILYCDHRLTVGVSPESALLCGPSAPEMARAMAELADSAERRAGMSAAARALAPSLTTKAMAEKYLAVYDQAIREPLSR